MRKLNQDIKRNFETIKDSTYKNILKDLQAWLPSIGIEEKRIQYVSSLGNDYIEIYPFTELNYDKGNQDTITFGSDCIFNIALIFQSDERFNKEEDIGYSFKNRKSRFHKGDFATTVSITELKTYIKESLSKIIAEARKRNLPILIDVA